MCKVSDLVVMVVDSNEADLKRACTSLGKLGITKIVCVYSLKEAIEFLSEDANIDIVLADYEIEEGKELGLLLVSVIKQQYPSISIILNAKDYSCSVVLDSIKRNADDIFNKNIEDDIEQLIGKWITLAQLKIETRELFNGKRPTTA